MDIASLTAAPVDFTIGDKTYRMSALTLADAGELDSWLRSRVVAIARASLPPDATPAERQETLSVAMKAAASISWTRDVGSAMAETPEVIVRLFWQGMRRHHHALTFQAALEMFSGPEAIEAAMLAFEQANGTGKASEAGEKKPEPATAAG